MVVHSDKVIDKVVELGAVFNVSSLFVFKLLLQIYMIK